MPSHTDDLRLAHILADDADSTTMDRYKALDLHVATKPDLTPVSESDKKVEDVMRKTLARARPRDAFVGEEDGTSGWGVRRWVVDPIDGTKNYIRGVPVWATLISLMIEDQVVVGVVSAPALGKRWWASYGDGAWTGRALHSSQPCRVSDVSKIEDASLSYASLKGWEKIGKKNQWADLMDSCWRTRAYGDFWSYMLVAEGAVDIAAEPELNLYDMAALAIIVDEAGGKFTSVEGSSRPERSERRRHQRPPARRGAQAPRVSRRTRKSASTALLVNASASSYAAFASASRPVRRSSSARVDARYG